MDSGLAGHVLHMQVLQWTQNAALRIATGCVRSTPVAHLHAELKVLPLEDHLKGPLLL